MWSYHCEPGFSEETERSETPTRSCFRSSEKLACFFVLLASCFTFARGGVSPWAPGRPGSLPDLFVHTPRVGLGCWPVSLCPGFPCSLELRQPWSSSSKRLVWPGRAKQAQGGIAPLSKGLCRLPPQQGQGPGGHLEEWCLETDKIWRLKGPEENEEREICLTAQLRQKNRSL